MRITHKKGGSVVFHKSDVDTLKNAEYLLGLFVRTEDPAAGEEAFAMPQLSDGQLAVRAAKMLAELCKRRGAKYLDEAGDPLKTPRQAAIDVR